MKIEFGVKTICKAKESKDLEAINTNMREQVECREYRSSFHLGAITERVSL